VEGWDKERALFPKQICAFIKATQPKVWRELRDLHGAGLEPLLLATLAKELDAKTALHVLRHGFRFYGKTLHLAYFKPAHGANYEVLKQFEQEQLTVTRQVPCHPSNNSTMDIVLCPERPARGDHRAEEPRHQRHLEECCAQYKETAIRGRRCLSSRSGRWYTSRLIRTKSR
jgi:type I restriction enzyme R subunit